MNFNALFFTILFIVSPIICAYEVSNSQPSYKCSKSKYFAEMYTCKDANLMEIDNKVATEYSFLKKISENPKSIFKSQVSWINKKNSCTTYKCLKSSYENRLQDIRRELVRHYSKNSIVCPSSELEAIFSHFSKASREINIYKTAYDIYPFYSFAVGTPAIDVNEDGVVDSAVRIIPLEESQFACSAMNCSGKADVLVKVNSCYTFVSVPTNRTDMLSVKEAPIKLTRSMEEKGLSRLFPIVTTYNVMGCAGSEGTRTYWGLDLKQSKYISFAAKDYGCEDGEQDIRFFE